MTTWLRVVAGFSLLLVAACSGSGAASDQGGSESASMRTTLGTSTRDHIVRTTDEVLLNRYGFRFNRRVDTAEDVRLETSWKDVIPMDDEQAQAFTSVRVRITVTSRPRSRSGGTPTYSARFQADVLGRGEGLDWVELPITAQRRAYLREITDLLENEFKGGVR